MQKIFIYTKERFCVDGLSAWWFRVLITPTLGVSWWWKSNSKDWYVCVSFLYTLMLKLPSSSVCTTQSKKGRLFPLTSSCMTLILMQYWVQEVHMNLKTCSAMAGNRTRVNCLEGSYAHHYTTIAWKQLECLPQQKPMPVLGNGEESMSHKEGQREEEGERTTEKRLFSICIELKGTLMLNIEWRLENTCCKGQCLSCAYEQGHDLSLLSSQICSHGFQSYWTSPAKMFTLFSKKGNTPLPCAAYSTVACTFCVCTRCNKWVALVLWVVNQRLMHATLFTFNQNKT